MRHRNDDAQRMTKAGDWKRVKSINFSSFSLDFFSSCGIGRYAAPHTIPFRVIPASMSMVPCHPYCLRRKTVSGANTNVPTPLPHDAMPVASARFLLK